MDEFRRIARLKHAFSSESEQIRLGIGDDAAILRLAGDVVISTDASNENVHFRRSFGSLRRIGRRAFHAAASDLAAMGATGACAFASLALPRGLADEDFDSLIEGLRLGARELSMPIAGGNLAAASEIGITLTVVGTCGPKPLTRSGARPGDGVYVSGTVGGAALSLRRLLRDEPNDSMPWFEIRARFDIARSIAEVATACIDVSDGLAADLGHLLESSGVGTTVDVDAIPIPDAFESACDAETLDWFELAFSGGEDYELCFTSAHDLSSIATRIGTIEPSPGLRVRRGDSVEAVVPRGHRHFVD